MHNYACCNQNLFPALFILYSSSTGRDICSRACEEWVGRRKFIVHPSTKTVGYRKKQSKKRSVTFL